MNWNDATTLYLVHLRAANQAKRTIYQVEHDLAHVSRTIESEPDEVSVDELRAFQCGLLSGTTSHSGNALAAGTVARFSATLRGVFGFLCGEGLLPTNPAANLERPYVPQKQAGRALKVRQVKRLLGATRTPLERAVIEVLYFTGIRRAELLGLDLGDLDHTERELLIRHAKGGRVRTAPLPGVPYKALNDYVCGERGSPSTSAVFVSARGLRLYPLALTRILNDVAKRAKLSGKLTCHDLRRTFATQLLKNGASLRHIQLLLGHASLNTTAIYLRLDPEELRQELILHHPRSGFDV